MRFLNYKFLPLLISIFLFIIPFFWLKSGWMDLGGDSSRLYFYDPLNYLNSLPLYGITPDGIGTVVTGYFLLPFVVLLLIFKNILSSSYLLITLFNSFSLVVSFVSIYFITFTFLDEFKKEKIDKSLAGSLAGLFYIFSPILTIIGWEKALTVHNQIFLNPLMFLLLLKYIHSKKIGYLFIALLISFVFAPNFSPSPYLLSFFPLAVLFILIYALKIKKIRFSLKEVFISVVLLIGIHLFHLLPMFFNFFSQNSAILSSTFSDQGKFVRGLSYFLSIAENIKLTNNIWSLPQNVSVLTNFNFLWIVFPLIILIGLLINKKISKSKTFLLLAVFFLIALFFDTANITSLGLNFYKSFFNIPGFSMFRNYWGQFGHVFIFFYTLVLGQALFYIFFSVKDAWKKVLVFLFIALLIIVNSWSFIKGDTINSLVSSSSNVRIPIKMDPDYEKFLDLIRKDQIDAKYVTLPLTDSAYQVIGGKMGGAYMAPSTIAYLTQKKDFSGIDDFSVYADNFLSLAKGKDYTAIQKLFSILNIKYIVYNSDQSLYDNFPKYPFEYAKKYFPTLESYKELLSNLNLEEKYHIGNYYLYSVKNENYLPHFYATNKIVAFLLQPEDWNFLSSFYSFAKDRVTIGSLLPNENTDILLKAEKIDIYTRINKDYPLPISYPFAKWELNSPIYPFIVFKESRNLDAYKLNDDSYIDRVIFYNSKRISELARWEGGITVLGGIKNSEQLTDYYKEPRSILDYFNKYNSWEISLSRYVKGLSNITDLVNKSKNDLTWKYKKKSEILESIKNNQIILNQIIDHSLKPDSEKKYLYKLLDDVFIYFSSKNYVTEYNPSILEYSINGLGKYDIYVENNNSIDLGKSKLAIGNNEYLPSAYSVNDPWVKFNNVNLDGKDNLLTVNIPSANFAGDYPWVKASDVLNNNSSSVLETSTVEKIDIINGNSSTSLQTSTITVNVNKELENGFAKQVTNLEDNAYYLISLDYLTYGNTFEFSLWTRSNPDKNSKKLPSYIAQFHEGKNTNNWTNLNVVMSSKNLRDAIIIIKPTKNGKNRIDIQNFKVAKLPFQPSIIAKRIEEPILNTNIPNISFEKINPTKYKVKITGAKDPYTLVFLEAFDKNWKVYLDPNVGQNKTVASYFDGSIKQELSKNIFLDNSTFETWNKKPILENSHFVVNGYANAWLIDPKNVGNRKNYTLIIELQNEKIFYVSLGISIFSVLICTALLLKNLIKQ